MRSWAAAELSLVRRRESAAGQVLHRVRDVLTATPGDAPAEAPEAPAAEILPEERRNATVLFADLSGYTAVAERMDPEAVKTLVERALRRLGQEVSRHGGRVDKYIGDNVMAVFGAPVSHEDDPERAVRAALAMQAAMPEINESIAGPVGVDFELRVGINSGEVLAGQVGDEYTVIGDPVNVASRLQAAARPGSVTIGEGTFRPTRQAIEYEELEPLELKGKSKPVPAWEATGMLAPGATRRPSRAPHAADRPRGGVVPARVAFRAGGARGPSAPRDRDRPCRGRQVAADQGARRSTLGNRPEPPAIREGHCPAYGAGIGYWALAEVLRGQFEIVDTDDSDVAWGKLRHGVEELVSGAETEEPPERLAAIIARPLGIEPSSPIPSPRPRHRGPAGDARPPLLRGPLGRRSGEPRAGRSCWPSRTSTGRTKGCST